MTFKDHPCIELASQTIDLALKYHHAFPADFIINHHDTVITVIDKIPRLLEISGTLSDDNKLEFKFIQEKYSQYTELNRLAIAFVFGREYAYFKNISAGAQMAGHAFNLELRLEKVLLKEPEAFKYFFVELYRSLAFIRTEGFNIVLKRGPRWGHMESVAEKKILFQIMLKELEDRAEDIWLYGVLNNCTWA